ncbi:serine/threonine-protein kinase [Paenibacillus sp. FSL L8-0470]|uniref:serine/threonine-protein kinase n=1 Tax=Paenibacillus sp. FSL L8-0470 TaxID=2954688 RepID=UPI0030F92322
MNYESKLVVGQLLGDRYQITALIGTGGMSYVYLAEDIRLAGKRWAVKESMCFEGEVNYGSVLAEADMLISLNHKLFPRVADFYPPDEEGYCYLVMDYIEGVTLSQYMDGHPVPIQTERLISYVKQLLEVLCYLHGHQPPIIYRDLKPSNIMLTGSNSLMLIDFGIARSYRGGAGEDTEKLGTVGFAAPEQYGSGQSGPFSDLYGLGALMLYMASAGQYSRWQPGMEAKLRRVIPDKLIPVIRRLLRHHPEERYQCAEEVLRALEPIEAAVENYTFREMQVSGPETKREMIIVALLGTASGLGTTHTSLAVASSLSRKGMTAWVDFSPDSSVYDRIRSLFDFPVAGGFPTSKVLPLEWKELHFWQRPEHGNMKEILERGYQFVVLDLGTGGYEAAFEAFTDSEVPMLITSGAEWRLEDTLHWLRRNGLVPQPKWRICLPFAGKSAALLLESALGIGRVYNLPLQQDPFQRKGKLLEVLDELLSESMKKKNYEKRYGFFQKRT